VGSIAPALMVFLMSGSFARGQTGNSPEIPVQSLPGVGARDPRIRVDPDAIPWRAVGKFQVAIVNFRASCTATLVSPSTVLTAAHCLFNRRTRRYYSPGSLHFVVGYNSGRYAAHAVGINAQIGDGYDPTRPKETIGSDWALVFLDKSLGSPDRILPISPEPPENGATVMLGGYQQGHSLVLMADPQCRILGRFVDASGRLLLRDNCLGTNGVSGGPLLINTGGKWQVAAIEVAGDLGFGGGAAVVLDDAAKSVCEQAGWCAADDEAR